MIQLAGYSVGERFYARRQSLIYRAVRQTDTRPVVVKVLNREYATPEEVARLRHEYDITRQLKGDGIIEVYDCIRWQSTAAIIEEDFGAESLARWLASQEG